MSEGQDGVSSSRPDLKDILSFTDSKFLQAQIQGTVFTASGQRIIPLPQSVVSDLRLCPRSRDSTHRRIHDLLSFLRLLNADDLSQIGQFFFH
jgi:hypothetical protein